MLDASMGPRTAVRTIVLVLAAVVFAVGAGIAGMDDNPPGIVLAYLSAVCLVVAVTHSWRGAAPFRRLILAAIGAFVAAAVLSNVLEALAVAAEGTVTGQALGFAGAVLFMIAVVLCPAALIAGVAGLVASRRHAGSA